MSFKDMEIIGDDKMIITATAMYLNIVYGASFDYFITIIGDIILCAIISQPTTVKNIIKKNY